MTWQPTWRRLVACTLVCFALLLALLAWRLQAGDDPALGRAAAITPTPEARQAPDPGGFQTAPDPGAFAPSPPSTHAS